MTVGILGFMLILTVVDLGGVIGAEAPPFASARTYCTLSLMTAAEVVTPRTVGLRYTEVLLGILVTFAPGSGFGLCWVQVSCCMGGLTGNAPAGAGGLLLGFNTAGNATLPLGLRVYA